MSGFLIHGWRLGRLTPAKVARIKARALRYTEHQRLKREARRTAEAWGEAWKADRATHALAKAADDAEAALLEFERANQ